MSPHGIPPQEFGTTESVDRIPARTLLEALARIYDLVLVTDSAGVVLWASNGLTELCGGASFHVGCRARSILPSLPEFPKPEQAFALRSQLRQRGVLANAQFDLAAAEGESISVEVNVVPVSTEFEEQPFYVVIARPVRTGKQPARVTGNSRNSSLTSILDDTPDAVLAVDARGFVEYANAAVERLVGHHRTEIVDRPIAALLNDAADLERLVSYIGVDRESGDWELTLNRSDGRAVRVAASARTRRLNDGSFGGTILCLRDVTQRHQVEEELGRKNAELEHCVHALAHDLRSPLVALMGFSRLLREDYGALLDDTGTHFVDRIEQAGRTMEDLIHDMLELSRIGKLGETMSLVDPKMVLQQLHAELKPRLDSANIQLELPHDSSLIFCDRTRLYQVFSNLIGNAIDHMGISDDPRIEVSIVEENDGQHVTVSDSGRGIAVEDHERIFNVFQSLGPASDGRRGTGIGLAIVKKIVDTHGGRIWLESRRGEGAAFHVTFPNR
jgi:two-component system CheB/CheR fusion protein